MSGCRRTGRTNSNAAACYRSRPRRFSRITDLVLRDDGGAPAIWKVAITEYVVIALLSFLAAARDGAVGVACIDRRMGSNGQGALVLLPSCVRREVDDIGLLEIIRGSTFDPVTSVIAYSRSSEVDRAWVEPAPGWYP